VPAGVFEVSAAVKAQVLEDNVIRIAWIPKALNNPVFELGKIGAETKAAELTTAGPYTVEIMYVGSVASDIAEQVKVMEDAIAAGAEAVGISCNEPTGCMDPIDEAMAAGVPVMTWDSDSPESARFTYLGVDNYEGGKAAAELLMQALPNGGKVALLSGVPGAANLEARISGFGRRGQHQPEVALSLRDDVSKASPWWKSAAILTWMAGSSLACGRSSPWSHAAVGSRWRPG
jgi:ribose transport system substrate-binding protein